jgi:MFS family permease
MDIYTISFLFTFGLALGTAYWQKSVTKKWKSEQNIFQQHYLVVYTLAYFADWLKGPYVYALYESYGLREDQIAMLFIIGFASSGISGPFVGSLADTFGRKRMALAYFIVYIASALCKPYKDYDTLLFGRILGGIGTSLLTTTFESWMVSEHQRRKYPHEMLDDTFSKATLLNSGAAIVAGIAAQISVNYYGYLAPFMLALVPLTVGFLLCLWLWDSDDRQTYSAERIGFQATLKTIGTNLWVLGSTQSLFLGVMYIFVFVWTPALEIDPELPHGLVFSIFMSTICIGTCIFKCFAAQVEMLPYVVNILAALSFAVCCISINNPIGLFMAFIAFELACGIMFPTYGSLRSVYIPDEHRTTIMNIYRIPLNVFVVIVLLNKRFVSLQVVFGGCCIVHVIATVLWHFFKPDIKVMDGKEYEMGRVRDEEEEFGNISDELESDISDEDEIF